MDIENREAKTRLSVVVLLILIAILLLCVGYYFVWGNDEKLISLVGGAAVASIFSIMQIAVNWKNFSEYDKYQSLRVKEILPQRDNERYYEELIKDCGDRLDIIGVSCNRFMDDFADKNSNKHALIDALNSKKNLKVKFLVAGIDYVPDDIQRNFELIKDKMKSIQSEYGERFQYKYYDHDPNHSYVRIDSDILVGPHFPGVSSKHSPAIHLDSKSEYVEKYIEYFDNEWAKARDDQD